MKVFVVEHVRALGDGYEDVKLIGVYSSEEAAIAAVAELTKQPGFCDYPGGFSIHAHQLDRTGWEEGFVTIPHESAVATADDPGDLSALFAQLGAREPEQWAASQVTEGIPQLHRFLFLRQAWKAIVREEDSSWIESAINGARQQPHAPYAGVGAALSSLRAKGATNEEVTDLVRGVQAELLFQFCYLLEDPAIDEEEAADVAWGLFAVDDEGTPGERIVGLHESVLETDPTGREMRPRQRL